MKKVTLGKDALVTLGKHEIPLDKDGLPVGMPWDYGIATIGDEAIDWGETELLTPRAEDAGQPFRTTYWQKRYTAWKYSVNRCELGEDCPHDIDKEIRCPTEECGEWMFSAGQLILAKGIGKSPYAAFLCLFEWIGPSRFHYFDKDGEAVGRPWARSRVGIASNAEKQARNTFDNVLIMLANSPLAHSLGDALEIRAKDVRIPVGAGWSTIEILTSGGKSLEGAPFTFVILDESQYMTSKTGGTDLAEKLDTNLGKTGGRIVETTNVWLPGMDSVAESTNFQVQDERNGVSRTEQPVLQFWRQILPSPDLADREAMKRHLAHIYDEAPWVSIKSIMGKIYGRKLSAVASRRLYLNELTSADRQLVTPKQWSDAKGAPPLKKGETVTLGFDGSEGDDYTVLVACRVSDRSFHNLNAWQANKDADEEEAEFDKSLIADFVEGVFEDYDVVAGCFDMAYWDGYIRGWEREYGPKLKANASKTPLAWDMRKLQLQTAEHHELFLSDLDRGDIKHSGDELMRQHVMNARSRFVGKFKGFGKETINSPKKIDLYAGMVMADIALAHYLEGNKKKTGGAVSWGF